MNPLDYNLCVQTVSLYRRQGDQAERIVLENCFLQMEDCLKMDVLGQQSQRSFLLIVPGQEQLVFPGDRITEGVGPETLTWDQTDGFAAVEYATPCLWQGAVCHTEAGRKG